MIDIFSYKLGQKSGGGSGGGGGGGGGGSNEEWIGDGNTHLWISLPEGRTSPMLGVGVNGTVTVDWGDGSTPDVLTGTSTRTAVYTPNHAYGEAGDYVITLSGNGEIGFAGGTYGTYLLSEVSDNSDGRNYAYRASIQKIECGDKVKAINNYAFSSCYSLANVTISNSVTSISSSAFESCYILANIVIPNSVTSINSNAFTSCYGLANIVIPNSVTSIDSNVFSRCYSLANIVIPNSVTSIGPYAFLYCYSLASVVIPDGVTSIGERMFYNCYSVAYYDFSNHTTVPTLAATSVFNGIPADCEIRVPAALADEWKAATNWSTYADKIVGV